MLVVQVPVDSKKPSAALKPARLVGYLLTTDNYRPAKDAVDRLEDRSEQAGFHLTGTEWDIGRSQNPYRVGLWRALRRLTCDKCEPRRLAFSLANFEDFIAQALKPCMCGNKKGIDGLVVARLDQLTNDPRKGARLVLELARAGKHLYADDGVCMSCCHPATKEMLGRQH